MTKRMARQARAGAVLVVAAIALGAAALAYFTATGSGHAPAHVATAQNLTISSAAVASSALYPGGSSDVDATVHNPNSFAVHVHAFTLDTGESSDGIASDAFGCTSGGNTGSSTNSVTFNGPVTNGGSDFVFGSGDTTLTLPDALSMSTTAENACQGATFTVYLQASS